MALGPDHDLHIAARFIVRLNAAGDLAWVAGGAGAGAPSCDTPGCPVAERHLADADGLAFDGRGNLIVSSDTLPGLGYALAEVKPSGETV